jgi:hypothetical protein
METAVEWLVEKLMKGEYINDPDYLITQAKEMEKEQIINAAMWMPEPFNSIEFIPELAKQYYNENYGKM